MTVEFARHAALEDFDVAGGELLVGGVPVTQLARRVGDVPFYAYDRAAIRRRVAKLRAAMPEGVLLHYAMKCNPMPAVVQLLARLTDGLDVASAGEMRVALDTGTDPRHVSFAGPGKRADEIAQAVAAGVTINLESARQLDHALAAAERSGVAPRLAIRVNPSFELKASGMKMGGGAKQFGVDEDEVPALAARIEAAGIALQGFHIFCGSQVLASDAIVDAQTRTVELGLRLAGGLARGIQWLNIGGGFGVPYFPGERALDLAPIGANLDGLARRVKAEAGAPVVLELGRYFVADAGVYVCRVLERKVSHGQVFLVTNGGLHHHLAASGNFGQVIRKNYPVAIGNRMNAAELEVQSVVGPLCTPLDLLADRMELAAADEGDLVVVFRSGAYGRSASPAGFLSHPECAEVLV